MHILTPNTPNTGPISKGDPNIYTSSSSNGAGCATAAEGAETRDHGDRLDRGDAAGGFSSPPHVRYGDGSSGKMRGEGGGGVMSPKSAAAACVLSSSPPLSITSAPSLSSPVCSPPATSSATGAIDTTTSTYNSSGEGDKGEVGVGGGAAKGSSNMVMQWHSGAPSGEHDRTIERENVFSALCDKQRVESCENLTWSQQQLLQHTAAHCNTLQHQHTCAPQLNIVGGHVIPQIDLRKIVASHAHTHAHTSPPLEPPVSYRNRYGSVLQGVAE